MLNCTVIDHTTLKSLKEFKTQYEIAGGSVIFTNYELYNSKKQDDTSFPVKDNKKESVHHLHLLVFSLLFVNDWGR